MKSRPIIPIALAFLAPLVLSSCIGLEVEYNSFGSDRNAVPSATPRQVAHSPSGATSPITKQMVLDAWGKPDRSEHTGDTERWIYDVKDSGTIWHGLTLYLVLPIPLPIAIGSGHNYVAIDFKGNVVSGVETRSQGESGFVCPAYVQRDQKIKIGCMTSNDPHHGPIPYEFYSKKPMTGSLKHERTADRPVPMERGPHHKKRKAIEHNSTTGALDSRYRRRSLVPVC